MRKILRKIVEFFKSQFQFYTCGDRGDCTKCPHKIEIFEDDCKDKDVPS